ncbi:MAG TPA: sulfatase-like hydrolase/transferase [Candidatus Binataceae bacterium]
MRNEVSPRSQVRENHSAHAFALFLALVTVMTAARFLILHWPPLRRFLPLLMYQDVLFCFVLAWGFHALFARFPRSRAGLGLLIAAWCVTLLAAAYAAIHVIIYSETSSPLTYFLWVASGQGHGIDASIARALPLAKILIPSAVVLMIAVAESLWRLAPRLVTRMERASFSLPGLLVLAIYVVSADLWVHAHMRNLRPAANPEWAFAASLFDRHQVTLPANIPISYFDDFRPRGDRAPAVARASTVALSPAVTLPSGSRPLNVLMIVMESVGTRSLQLYGAPHPETPEIINLARHGVVFDRIYASEAYSSAAMASLFCSLYPEHGWFNIPRLTPDIDVPGLGDVLASKGYRTAFVHAGALSLDNRKLFLRDHGFHDIIARNEDAPAPSDSALLPLTRSWIGSDFAKPFFLTIWTLDSHHPYFSTSATNFRTGNDRMNRYLNTVHATDTLIGQLARMLSEMKIADNTLIVITGDHGEAFGEHGQMVHGFSVYDEEVHVPLIFVSDKLFPRGMRIDRIGRQIDIAPTILGLLGYDEPPPWQGVNLFADNSPQRAYLFSTSGNFSLGFVEDSFKYIHDFDRNTDELYDLAHDPAETHDLSSDNTRQAQLSRDRLRVDAWLSFQDRYLANFSRSRSRPSSISR